MTYPQESPSLRRAPPPGYVMQSRDTEYWAEEAQFEYWRGLEPVDKAEIVSALCKAVFEAHMVGLRELFPGASEQELMLRSAALRYGSDFVKSWTGFDAELD